MSAWLLDVNGNWHEAKGDIETRIIDFITSISCRRNICSIYFLFINTFTTIYYITTTYIKG